jgi:O-antigen/teichoic acid export membrane protein
MSIEAKSHTVAGSISATLVANIVSVGINLVVGIIIARSLGPNIKGRIDLVNSTSYLAAMIFGFSLSSGITFIVARQGVNLRRLSLEISGLALLGSLLAYIVLALVAQSPIAHAFVPKGYSFWGSVVIATITFALIIGSYWRALLLGLQQFILSAKVELVSRVLQILVTGFILLSVSEREVAALFIIGVTPLLSLLVWLGLAITIRRYFSSAVGPSVLPEIAKYSSSSYVADFVQFANYRLDVFIIAYILAASDVGLYATAVSLAQLIWLPVIALQGVLFPRLTAITDSGRQVAEAAQTMRLTLALAIIMSSGLAFLAPWFVSVMFGPKFGPVVEAVWLLLPGVTIFCLARILCSYLAAIGKPHLNLLISILGTLVTVAGDVILIPKLGINGAALVSTVSYTLSGMVALYFFRRETGLPVRQTLAVNAADLRMLTSLWRTKLA